MAMVRRSVLRMLIKLIKLIELVDWDRFSFDLIVFDRSVLEVLISTLEKDNCRRIHRALYIQISGECGEVM